MESLICPVRACRLPLVQQDRALVCANRHSFDRARRGYYNLLQPQERRSKNPGDTADAVAARRRLHDRRVTEPLRQGITEALNARPDDKILDVGCGDGYYLGTLGIPGCGIDISIPAIEAAARRYPDCQWVVGNADRFIPYADKSFSILMSITARMNPPGFHRVLQKGGKLLVALPAPDDLTELRGSGRDRVERTLETFAQHFKLESNQRITTTADLDADAVHDVLLSIYRPRALESLEAKRVTFSLDVLTFRAS